MVSNNSGQSDSVFNSRVDAGIAGVIGCHPFDTVKVFIHHITLLRTQLCS